MSDILEVEKPKFLRLADGKEYEIPPLNLTTLANMEKTMGFGLGEFTTRLETQTMTTMRALIYGLLKENYPNLTLEGVGKLITLKEIASISETISQIMAMST